MVYTKAMVDAMNKQGAALLKAQQNNTYKPPVPTKTTYGSATSNAGYSLYDKPKPVAEAPAPSWIGGGTPTPAKTPTRTLQNTSSTIGVEPVTTRLEEQPIQQAYEAPVDNSAQILAELKAAQLKATIAGLDKSLTNSLGNLDTEQAGLGQTYYDKRNQAAAQSDIGAMNFAQRAAARGISGSAGSMPDLYRNNALQGELGSLNRDEAGMNAGIERNRTNLRNNYESDVAGANAGIEAQSLQNYITQMNQDRQQANTDRTYAATQTNNERNSYMDVTGAYSNDYQAEINRLQNDGDSSNDWKIAYLQSERNKKIAEQKSIDEEITLARIKAGY